MPHHQVIVTSTSGKKRMFYWTCDDLIGTTMDFCSCLGPTDAFLQKLSRQSSTIAVVYLIYGIQVESYHRERRSNGELE